jgi:PIN domain nuclease of toxin-antitoxin system
MIFSMRKAFTLVPVTLEHVALSSHLPLHHRDPFDRMLIAQACHEKLTLVTHNARLFAYPIPIVKGLIAPPGTVVCHS